MVMHRIPVVASGAVARDQGWKTRRFAPKNSQAREDGTTQATLAARPAWRRRRRWIRRRMVVALVVAQRFGGYGENMKL